MQLASDLKVEKHCHWVHVSTGVHLHSAGEAPKKKKKKEKKSEAEGGETKKKKKSKVAA